LIHDSFREEPVQFENVVVTERFPHRVFLDVTQAGKVVEHLALRPLLGSGEVAPLFEGAHLLQRERVALDGGGGVAVAGAGVLLKRGDPCEFDGRPLDALAQRGYRLGLGEEIGSDGKNGLEAHMISQALVHLSVN